jgi:hypothetical protein
LVELVQSCGEPIEIARELLAAVHAEADASAGYRARLFVIVGHGMMEW